MAPQALRHHRPALRQRPVPHRAHHSNPSRPTSGSASSACAATSAISSCADDAHGAPIMLKAAGRGNHVRRRWLRASRPTAPRYLSGFHIGFDHWYSTRLAGKHRAFPSDIYRRLKHADLIYVKPVEQFYDPVKGMFLRRPLHQGRMSRTATRRTNTPTLARSAASSIRPPISSILISTLSGAKPVLQTSDHYFLQAVRSEVCRIPERWLETPERLQSQVREQGSRVARPARVTKPSGTGTSRAMLRTSAFRSRTRRASSSTCGWMLRSAISLR